MQITWYCNIKYKGKGKHNKFWHKLPSRVDAWKREIFPLDVINNLISDRKCKSCWKMRIYERIYLLASDGKYYNLISDVDVIEFRRENKVAPYLVSAKLNSGEELQVLTLCADHSRHPMRVKDPKEVSIDHVEPLKSIMEQILSEDTAISHEIEKVIAARKDFIHSMSAKEIAKKIRNDVDVSLLISLKEMVLKKTICLLMEQRENSKKCADILFYNEEKSGQYFLKQNEL